MNAYRIFADAPSRPVLQRPRREPPITTAARGLRVVEAPVVEVPIETPEPIAEPVIEPPIAPVATEIEHQIVAILTSPSDFGETIDAAFRRKERELAVVFARLTKLEAHALTKRLSDPRDGDALAGQFGRLVVERRTRLLAVLARFRSATP